eukprot:TRINITY_DN90581_c0_g1_i1.p1 TRINITY_DN90581_c0_g1~~TRINITY_DN90581_c0_g1_i1.p1  ORF type:complete len:356 (+),score=67.63 TRINITY_DN90581_c0_g1_i1:71-1138(+)
MPAGKEADEGLVQEHSVASLSHAPPDHADVHQRQRSVTLLLCGAICGFLGFAFAGFLGIWRSKVEDLELNYLGEPMPSGRNFWPPSVSMMVRDPASPSGKCFFAFQTVAAICIMMSWYPWQLRNVYVGTRATMFGVNLLNLRTLLPPIGMMLVTHIQVIPPAQRGFRDQVAVGLHSLGAIMMIGGFGLFELHSLLSGKVHTRGHERVIRYVLVIIGLMCAVCFFILSIAVDNSKHLSICCDDIWRVPTLEEIETATKSGHPGAAVRSMLAHEMNRPQLYNTASGAMLHLKEATYWFEVLSGLLMICSHLTIWYYCPERQLALAASLPNPGVYWDGDEDAEVSKDKEKAAGYGAAA